MFSQIKKHHISFKNAFTGLKWSFTTQPNFIVHFLFALLAVILGWYVELSQFEWILLIFTIFWGLSAEMINTSIEAMTDLITVKWSHEAKVAKDVAAGMVFLTAIGTVIIGVLLLGPKLFAKLI